MEANERARLVKKIVSAACPKKGVPRLWLTDREAMVLRLRDDKKLTFVAIGELIQRSTARAQQIYRRACRLAAFRYAAFRASTEYEHKRHYKGLRRVLLLSREDARARVEEAIKVYDEVNRLSAKSSRRENMKALAEHLLDL